MSGSETVVAYFKSPSEAERALSNLRDAGFTREQTGFANSSLLHNRGNQSSLDETGDQRNFTTSDQDSHSEGIWDRIVHFFEGDSTQGSGIGDTNDNIGNNNDDYDNDVYGHDEWSGSLGSMGLSGERSRYFEQQLNNGREGALITVQAGDRRQEAEQILRSSGGDLGENAANFQTQERSENWEQDRGSASQSERQRVQLLGEVLRVHKERVSKGEVRLRKEVVTENQNIQVPVSRRADH